MFSGSYTLNFQFLKIISPAVNLLIITCGQIESRRIAIFYSIPPSFPVIFYSKIAIFGMEITIHIDF